MSKSAFIRVRIEPELKSVAEAILERLGISSTQAITMLYKRIICDKAWPLALNVPIESLEKDTFKDDIEMKTKDTEALKKSIIKK